MFRIPASYFGICLILLSFSSQSFAQGDESCAKVLESTTVRLTKRKKIAGIHVSIRDWISSLTSDELVSFVPDSSKIRLNERGIASPRMRKLLSKLRDRINLDHGALFAITENLSVIDDQLELLGKTVQQEPLLIRRAFSDLLARSQDVELTEITPEEKAHYKKLISDYKNAVKDPRFIKNKQRQEGIHEIDGDPKYALVDDSPLSRAIRYQAEKYLGLLKLIQTRRDESVRVFSEIAKRHFITEEVLMANLVDNISRLEKHLAAHDAALANFNHMLSDSNLPLGFEVQSRDLKMVSVIFNKWLINHIKGNDQIDYGDKLLAKSPDQFFSIQDRSILNDSERLVSRWDLQGDGFKSVQDYLLKSLNSDKIFFVES